MNKRKLAGCVILDNENRILLLHRQTDRRQQWEMPGGRIEGKEVSATAAAREVEEEIGVPVTIIRQLGTRDFEEDGFTLEYTWFLAKIDSGQPEITEPEKYDGLQYFTWEELLQHKKGLSANIKNLLEEYAAGKLDLF
jgi:8-oxo-dGTP diphosphatase